MIGDGTGARGEQDASIPSLRHSKLESPMSSSLPRCRKVVVLGSTGSIGQSALAVAGDIPERMEIVGLAANRSVEALARQAKQSGVRHVALCDVSQRELRPRCE